MSGPNPLPTVDTDALTWHWHEETIGERPIHRHPKPSESATLEYLVAKLLGQPTLTPCSEPTHEAPQASTP